MGDKNRYTDEELKEFKELILKKLEKAQEDYKMYKNSITQGDGNDISDTSPTFKVLEEGAATLSKEEAGKLAQRQQKFIQHLQAALVQAVSAQDFVLQRGDATLHERQPVQTH